MAEISEIAPDVYRISTFVPEYNLVFNQFLVNDDEPLLFHAGLRSMFSGILEAIARVVEPSRLRWLTFSHFEADECGSLNGWLETAPHSEPACNIVAAAVSINDYALRPARIFSEDETFETGRRRFRLLRTPHLPHGWDAGLLFEETGGVLFCSDLFHQTGPCPPMAAEVIDGTRRSLLEYQASPFAYYMPYTPETEIMLNRLAGLQPRTLAVMHGPSYSGDCALALRQLAGVFREVLGGSGQ